MGNIVLSCYLVDFGTEIFGRFLVNQLRIFGGDFWEFLLGIFGGSIGSFWWGFLPGGFGVLFTSFTEVFGYTNTVT